MQRRTVLITGATGFIGSHLAGRLAADGADLRLLLRPSSSMRYLRDVPHHRRLGDLATGKGIDAALDGVDAVYHLAAVLRATRREAYLRGNVEGTRNLVAAIARKASPPRTVIVSSLAAWGPSPDGHPLTEADPPQPRGNYGDSKLLSEKAARDVGRGVPLVILRPPAVYGPREGDFLAACRAIERGILPHVGHARRTMSLIYSDDLVQGMIDAMDRAPVGGAYFVTHPEILTWSDILAGIAGAMGRTGRRITFPETVIPVIAAVGEALSRIRGKETLINRERSREWRHRHWVCDPARARTEWGLQTPTPFAEGIKRTIAWYREEGLIRGHN
jgi:nucleoside-diphosphate-sugar epimerase